MSSENCSRRLACPRPTCWSATPAAGPLPDVSLIILCSMATDAFKEAVSGSAIPGTSPCTAVIPARRPAQRDLLGGVTSQFPAADGFHRGPRPVPN
jgi:hypothetical protein